MQPRNPDGTPPAETTSSQWIGWIALLWAGSFFYLGVSSDPPVPQVDALERLDLVGHAVASGLLTMLVGEWFLVRWRIRRGVAWGVALGVGAGVGAVIEALQTMSPVRSFEVLDLLADGMGAAAGVWLHAYAVGRVQPRIRVTVGLAGAGGLAVVATAVSRLLV